MVSPMPACRRTTAGMKHQAALGFHRMSGKLISVRSANAATVCARSGWLASRIAGVIGLGFWSLMPYRIQRRLLLRNHSGPEVASLWNPEKKYPPATTIMEARTGHPEPTDELGVARRRRRGAI